MTQLFVTLKSSENPYLDYPINGLLELFEIGTDGQLISGVWRGLNPNGGYYAPCAVRNVEFVYPAV